MSTALYVPSVQETDPKKQNRSLQTIGAQAAKNTDAIAANTSAIAAAIRTDIAQSFTLPQQDQAQRNIGLPAVMRSYLAGLTLSTPGSSPTFSVAAGVAADSTNADMMQLASAMSKTTSAWAAGSGNGALDIGSIAPGQWYHVFVIKNPTSGAVDVLISANVSAPSLPSGYTLFRRIGSMKTDGLGHWLSFVQADDEFIWVTTVNDVPSATPTSAARTLVTLSVPTGVQVGAMFRAYYTNAVANSALIFTSPDEADQTAGSYFDLSNSAANGFTAGSFRRRTNTNAQVGARGVTSTGTYGLATYGWIDRRGRDA